MSEKKKYNTLTATLHNNGVLLWEKEKKRKRKAELFSLRKIQHVEKNPTLQLARSQITQTYFIKH